MLDVEQEMSEKRLGIYWIDIQDFMALIGKWGASGRYYCPVLAGLPADAEIVDVCYDWHRNTLGVKVSHPSFRVVPEGDRIPWIGRLEVWLTEPKEPASASAGDSLSDEPTIIPTSPND